MKKSIIQFLFALLPVALFSQAALYIEFNGSGILHQGVIVPDDTGKGICVIGFQMNGQKYTVVQDAVFSASPLQNPTAYNGQWNQPQQPRGLGNGWQTGPTQEMAYFITCNNPRQLKDGKPAYNYIPDNFITVNGQMIVKSANLLTNVNARAISQQELTAILQQLGVPVSGTNQQSQNKAVPPVHLPKDPPPTPNGKGPKYPSGKKGGLG